MVQKKFKTPFWQRWMALRHVRRVIATKREKRLEGLSPLDVNEATLPCFDQELWNEVLQVENKAFFDRVLDCSIPLIAADYLMHEATPKQLVRLLGSEAFAEHKTTFDNKEWWLLLLDKPAFVLNQAIRYNPESFRKNFTDLTEQIVQSKQTNLMLVVVHQLKVLSDSTSIYLPYAADLSDLIFADDGMVEVQHYWMQSELPLSNNALIYAIQNSAVADVLNLIKRQKMCQPEAVQTLFALREPAVIDRFVKLMLIDKQPDLYKSGCDALLVDDIFEQAFLDYTEKFNLSPAGQEALIKTQNDDKILTYLKSRNDEHALCNSAEELLFDVSSQKVRDFYEENFSLSYRQERQLIKCGNKQRIEAYIQKHRLKNLNEVLWVTYPWVDVAAYVKQHGYLSNLGEVALMKKGTIENKAAYALKVAADGKTLYQAAVKYFLQTSREDALAFIEKNSNRLEEAVPEGVLLVAGKKDLVLRYQQYRKISGYGWLIFAYDAPVESVIALIAFCAQDNLVQSAVVRRKDARILKALIACTSFNEARTEEAFIKETEDERLILTYIRRYQLSVAGECALIKREKAYLVEQYIALYPLSDKANDLYLDRF
jgi:hypothetical protein